MPNATTPETDKYKWFTTKSGGCVVEVVGVSLSARLEKQRDELYATLKEVTDQMNNSGNGEHTIPSWFARSLYEVLDKNKAEA